MGRINKFPNDSWEDLLSRYEAMKASGKYGYLDAEEIADLANHYLNLMNMEEVAQVIEYGLQLHPGNPVIRIEQGFYYLDMDEPEKAREVVKDISDDWSEEVIFLKVELALLDKNVEEAKRLFSKLDYEDDLELIIRIAYVWLDLGFPAESLTFLEGFREKLQEEEDFLNIYAEAYLQTGKPREALTYYNLLLDRQPYSAAYWVSLGRCYYELEEYGKCIEACDFALAADETFSMAHLFKGDALFMLNEDEKAVLEYEKSITFQSIPRPLNALFFGLKYFSLERYQEAIPFFEEILQELSADEMHIRMSVYNYLPAALLTVGNIEGARKYTDEWLQHFPADPYAHLMSIRICVGEKNYFRLEQAARETIRLTQEVEVLYEAGELCLQAGLYQLAREAFEKVKELDSNFKNIDIELLSTYLHLHDKEKVETLLMQISSEKWSGELSSYLESCSIEEEKSFMDQLTYYVDQLRDENKEENTSDQQ